MKEIKLTQGKVALVDDEDYEWLNQWKWCLKNEKNSINCYAQRHDKIMHRLIIRAKKGQIVDHVDGNGLNNQKSNLRICTNNQNQFNSKKRVDNTSGYKGVTWDKNSNKWRAQININGKRKSIGYFTNQMDAAKAYDWFAIENFGEFAKINFTDSRKNHGALLKKHWSLHQRNNTGYRGVCQYRGKWRSSIGHNGKVIYLGDYDDPKQAALAYNKAALEHFGEFARINDV